MQIKGPYMSAVGLSSVWPMSAVLVHIKIRYFISVQMEDRNNGGLVLEDHLISSLPLQPFPPICESETESEIKVSICEEM